MLSEYGLPNGGILAETHIVALPAAGAAASTPAMALNQTGREFYALVAVPATPSLASGKNLLVYLEDSADGETWAAQGAFPLVTVAGGASGGGVPVTVASRIPPGAAANVRVSFSVEADGGDNTAVEATVKLLFVQP